MFHRGGMQIEVKHNKVMVDNKTQPEQYEPPLYQNRNSTDGYINSNTHLTDPLGIEIGTSFTSPKLGFR